LETTAKGGPPSRWRPVRELGQAGNVRSLHGVVGVDAFFSACYLIGSMKAFDRRGLG
jgi:hypothetical protein